MIEYPFTFNNQNAFWASDANNKDKYADATGYESVTVHVSSTQGGQLRAFAWDDASDSRKILFFYPESRYDEINGRGLATWEGAPGAGVSAEGMYKVNLCGCTKLLGIKDQGGNNIVVDDAYLSNPTSGHLAVDGVAPFSADIDLDFTSVEDVEAYMVSSDNGSVLNMEKVTGSVPAHTGLILKQASQRLSVFIPTATECTQDVSDNLLVATSETTDVAAGDYVIDCQDDVHGLYRVGSEAPQLAGGQCYLAASAAGIMAPSFALDPSLSWGSIIDEDSPMSDLSKFNYLRWNGTGADATIAGSPWEIEYNLLTLTDQVWGHGAVWNDHYADLGRMSTLEIMVKEGAAPRCLFNRQTDGTGLLDLGNNADLKSTYVGVVDKGEEGTLYVVNIAKLKRDYGFVHLQAIKGANYGKLYVTGLKVRGEQDVITSFQEQAQEYMLRYNNSQTTYERAVTPGRFGTICLPKAVAAEARSGAVFYNVTGVTTSGSVVTNVVLEPETGDLVAGKPYVFLASETSLQLTYHGDAVIEAVEADGLVGTLDPAGILLSTPGKYFLSNNQLRKLNGGSVKIGEMKAYFDLDALPAASAPSNRALFIQLEETEEEQQTAIESLETVDSMGEAFSIAGHSVASPRQGLYIVNGKKMFIK